ncbi:hypothetical protein MKW92_034396 [Papaver armeniacum]|nr:hypothetical protein MKW92_034396 [Papaver armeniacum]
MDYLEGHLCAHIAFTCSCDVGYYILTPPSSAQENNPSSLRNKIEILLRSTHNQIEDGTAETVSCTRSVRLDVIKDFKSCSLVVHKTVSMLSDLKVPERCFDYVTGRILDCVSQIPAEALGGTYCVTAYVMITFEENLDGGVTESMEEGVTESMEEENARRIPAAASFINGLKKEEYRLNHGDNNDCSSATTSCAVCFEGILDGSEVSSMPCSHMFHYDCLVTWLNEINSCPVCGCQVEPAE